jgi:hypothetical protein
MTEAQREAAFWAKVDKTGEHWLWTGHVGQNGYGQFWNGERVVGAHVFAWEIYGEVPEGQEIRHKCRHRHCVLHLTVGTRADNVADMVEDRTCFYHQQPERILRGDRHGKTKIPDALVSVLCTRHAQGESLRVLGEELGVTKQAIAYAIRRRGGGAQ